MPLIALLILAVPAVLLFADGEAAASGQGQQMGRGDSGGHPEHPLMVALDLDDDGALSADEIAGAVAALLTLDADGDGALSEDELRPAPPEGGAPSARR